MIYKYYPCTADYTKEMFETGYFYFATPPNSNDPWDTNLVFIKNYPDFVEELESSPVSKVFPSVNEFIKTFEEYGICCFSEEQDNEHLWSLYANNYSGLCLGFDENKCANEKQDGLRLYFNCQLDIDIILEHVKYKPKFLNLDKIVGYNDNGNAELKIWEKDELRKQEDCTLEKLMSDHKYFEKIISEIFTTKKKKIWATEKEIRLILPRSGVKKLRSRIPDTRFSEHRDTSNNLFGYKIDWPKDSIHKVIFGHKMCPKKVNDFTDIFSSYPNAKFFTTNPSIKEWKIEIIKK